MCFYEADTIVRVVREYPNPKFWVPEFSGIAKPVVILGICRCFETGGVPGPTSEMSLRAPAQMGRRETEREGGKRQPERERGGNPAAFVFVPRPGRVCLQ
jgi:hypothetical protein